MILKWIQLVLSPETRSKWREQGAFRENLLLEVGWTCLKDFLIETQAGKFLVWEQPNRNEWRGGKLLCYEVNIELWGSWMKQYENLKGSQDQLVPVNWKIVHKNYFCILDSAQKVKPKDHLKRWFKSTFCQSDFKPVGFPDKKHSETCASLRLSDVVSFPCLRQARAW